MSFEITVSRVAELQALLGGATPAAGRPPAPSRPPDRAPFEQTLRAASIAAAPAMPANGPLGAAGAVVAPGPPAGDTPAARMVAFARNEVGQAEMPPGSNDSPRIATYRTATAGSGVGPWCAYFTSWLAHAAGVAVGEQGQGFGSVDALYAWAQRTGRAIPVASGQKPQPGDLIVWDEHIGIVESVLPDGRIQTIEGNSSDQVARRVHAPGDAIGYVRLG
jgi:hypothetical protein